MAAAAALLMPVSLLAIAPSASAAAPPGDFSSSFESSDPQPATSTAEVDASGDPVQGNLSGSSPSGLPGSLLGQVSAVTASAENPPNEIAANLKDENPSTKWLAFNPTGWATYQLAKPAAVVKYSLTSANDAPTRDPKDFVLQGSDDGKTWTDLDKRTGQSFSGRFATNVYSFTNTTAYGYYRLNVTANSGDSLVQLADWNISDGSNTQPPATPMVGVVGTGPVSGYNMKPGAGFTGTASLRYSGGAQAAGRSYATDKLFDVNIPVGPKTRLSYKIFPEFTGGDTQYPSTYAAVDLHFTDGSYLSRLSPVDQHGYALTAAGQGASKVLYADQWNAVQSDIGEVAKGKTIDRVLLAYDDPQAKASTRFQGWLDDVTVTAEPAPIDGSSLTDYVDTRRGTNASGSFSRGNNLPITALPNDFNFFTPVTDAGSNSWEYAYQQNNNAANLPTLQGLAISHEPSPWMGDRNQMSVMPVPAGGSLTGAPSARAQAFSHNDEIARPDFYRVAMKNGMTAQMSPTDHGGIMQFSFPSGMATGSLVFYNGTFTIGTDGTFSGWVDNGSGLSAGRSRMFVYGTFDRAPTASTATAATFDTSATHDVTLRIATSFISVDQAHKNLDLEVTGKSFDRIHADATAAWNDRLGRIGVQGATETQLVTLYSNLYRLNLYPNSQSENTGTATAPHWQYASPVSAATGTSTATQTGAKIVDGQIYVNNGFWDTYRTVWPAYSLLYPDIAAKIADGFAQQYRDGGWIARWSSPGYADLMTGTSANDALAEAYLNGVKLPDPLGAYDAIVKDATVASGRSAVGRKGIETGLFLGYTPTSTGESVSWALEGFINDYAIGNMGAALAKDPATPKAQRARLQEESEYFLQRARNYVNLFDTKTKFFEGRNAAGTFTAGNPLDWGGVYTETDGWNFAFTAQQDGMGLANLYGGQQALKDKLDQFFATPENADHPGGYGGTIHEMLEARAVRMGQLGMSNQPSHHIPYMYDYAGAPSKTQAIVREILQRLYVGSEIGQGYPGDEDNGEMSSWYILSSLGLYPLQAGSSNWAIGSPQFTRMTVHRETGDIVVNAPDNSTKNVYVQSVKVNGEKQKQTSIDSSVFAHGGTIDFRMGPNPSAWGTGKKDAPPSLTEKNDVPQPLQDVTGPGLGTATATGGQDASKLFDDSSSTQMTFASGTPQVTWVVHGGRQQPTYYTLTSGASAGDPSDWELQGSRDGITWATLDRRSGEVFTWRNQTRPFKIDKPGKFTQFRLVVTKTTGAAQTNLAEIELLAGGDVQLGGGDIAVTPASSVHATSGVAVSASLASVTGGTASGYKATVDWGDGSPATAGTVTLSSRGVYSVGGSHTYAKPGYYQAKVTVTDGTGQGVATAGVDVAYAPSNSLTTAFDTVCIGDDGTLAANCDAKSWAYSRAALAAAGVTQGERHDVPGTALHFTLPAVPAGQPDDATGNGRKVVLNLPADAKSISFIGAGTQGNQSTTATATFSDGSTANIPIQMSDWTLGGNPNGTPSYGNIIVARSAYRLLGTNKDGAQPFLFATAPYQVPAGKTLVSVTLPTQTGDPGSAGRIHVFAIADDGTPAAALATTAPKDQTVTAGQVLSADLGSVKGGVPDSTGYHASVQWGDGTAPEDVTVGSDGAMSGQHKYAQDGTYTVHVTVWDTLSSSTETFTVTVGRAKSQPTISAAASAAPGDPITVTGSGFAAGEKVTVKLGTSPARSLTVEASAKGAVNTSMAASDGAQPGRYSVTAVGASSRTPATATVRVTERPVARTYRPEVTLSTTSGPRGTAITVNGSGFAPNEAVTMTFGAGLASIRVRANGDGVISGAIISVPGTAKPGATSITLAGARSAARVRLPFTVDGRN
ncbi:GH92 family glycosyl hydrolase [Actinoallomurus rhizosphaericola]|uniref:GH92 family glycosyl hydrolase n=1 Tax=Actinoallomurus rhizosphaericola TaxID=2952536 RepID=UPI002093D006|nr:GH92 family glycosyl hydrolase [Actinoallomurus rhizosphaericola]MCO5998044.1 GH92 family glycosyl hydrolase [Actinoallomurus rhizosphaericola]